MTAKSVPSLTQRVVFEGVAAAARHNADADLKGAGECVLHLGDCGGEHERRRLVQLPRIPPHPGMAVVGAPGERRTGPSAGQAGLQTHNPECKGTHILHSNRHNSTANNQSYPVSVVCRKMEHPKDVYIKY